MWRVAGLVTILTACNQWVRPNPPPPNRRTPDQQRAAAVRIETYCDPFDDGNLGKSRLGSGVMVTDWQVLTALHVVECRSAVPMIRVTNVHGQRWRFTPEREWVISKLKDRDGLARIQLASADDLSPRLPPPAVHTDRTVLWEPLYVQTANPEFDERVSESTGMQYGGDSYGGTLFTYVGHTEVGYSGSGVYDITGDLVGVHLGTMKEDESLRYGGVVTQEMVP